MDLSCIESETPFNIRYDKSGICTSGRNVTWITRNSVHQMCVFMFFLVGYYSISHSFLEQKQEEKEDDHNRSRKRPSSIDETQLFAIPTR